MSETPTPTNREDAPHSVDDFRRAPKKSFMSIQASIDICEALADEVTASGFEPDALIGIANGALMPTRVIADRLGMACEFVRYRRQSSTLKRRLGRIPGFRIVFSWLYSFKAIERRIAPIIDRFNKLDTNPADEQEKAALIPGAGKVLLVDDAIDSGQSIAMALKDLKDRGARDIRTVVISWEGTVDSKAVSGVEPQHYLTRVIHHYPWSENNPEYKAYREWIAARDLQEWT